MQRWKLRFQLWLNLYINRRSQKDLEDGNGNIKTRVTLPITVHQITKRPEGITERIHFNDISSLLQQPFVAEINHTLTLQAIEGVMRFFFQHHRPLPNTLYQPFWSFKSLRNCSDFIKALKKKKYLPESHSGCFLLVIARVKVKQKREKIDFFFCSFDLLTLFQF